jgi:hypothetical protein
VEDRDRRDRSGLIGSLIRLDKGGLVSVDGAGGPPFFMGVFLAGDRKLCVWPGGWIGE